MKVAASLIIGIIFGILIQKIILNNNAPLLHEKIDAKSTKASIKTPIKKLSITDCPSPKQETQKYNDAILYFLASIGVKNSDQYKNVIEQMVNQPEKIEEIMNSSPELDVIYGKVDLNKLIENKIFSESENPKELINEASQFVLADPVLYNSRAKFISDIEDLVKVNGFFVGKHFRFEGKNKGNIEEVELTINYQVNKAKEIDGDFRMKMLRGGQVFSDARGQGNNRDIRRYKNDKSVIIVCSPNSFVHFQDESFNVGNFYEDGVHVGIMTLHRDD